VLGLVAIFGMLCARLRPADRSVVNLTADVYRSSNIFDNVLAMMQKYAGTLESLVDERTAQLAQEKRTTEALLLRMLPKCVLSLGNSTVRFVK